MPFPHLLKRKIESFSRKGKLWVAAVYKDTTGAVWPSHTGLLQRSWWREQWLKPSAFDLPPSLWPCHGDCQHIWEPVCPVLYWFSSLGFHILHFSSFRIQTHQHFTPVEHKSCPCGCFGMHTLIKVKFCLINLNSVGIFLCLHYDLAGTKLNHCDSFSHRSLWNFQTYMNIERILQQYQWADQLVSVTLYIFSYYHIFSVEDLLSTSPSSLNFNASQNSILHS